jgi:hypothetical protein
LRRLKAKRGITKRKQRCDDVEPLFAVIKHNHQFRRFMLRGIEKVSIETGLFSISTQSKKTALKGRKTH